VLLVPLELLEWEQQVQLGQLVQLALVQEQLGQQVQLVPREQLVLVLELPAQQEQQEQQEILEPPGQPVLPV
jgi:hypothetical protein